MAVPPDAWWPVRVVTNTHLTIEILINAFGTSTVKCHTSNTRAGTENACRTKHTVVQKES